MAGIQFNHIVHKFCGSCKVVTQTLIRRVPSPADDPSGVWESYRCQKCDTEHFERRQGPIWRKK